MSNWGDIATKPGHLVVRFFTSLSPAPPKVHAELFADANLLPAERGLWVQMSNQDRRHSVAVAKRFQRRRPAATRPEIAGALLHDVGKIECGLGPFARVIATLLGPRTERNHEAIGARLVADAGSDPITVDLVSERGPAYPDLEIADH